VSRRVHGRRWQAAVSLLLVAGVAVFPAAAQEVAAPAREVYARALDLQRAGDESGALALLWQASGLAPHDPEVQNRLGEALARLGALDAAVEAFGRALSARPDFPKAANNLMLSLVQAGRGPEALQRGAALVAAAPRDADRHVALGLALSEQDVDAAIAAFRRALALAPRHALARYNLALVLQRADRLPEAADELRRAIDIEPRPEAHYSLGVISWHRGDLDAAERSLRAAVQSEPRYAAAFFTLGAVLKERRDWAGSSAALRRAIALQPDLTGAYVTLARVLQLSGDEAGARTTLATGERLRRETQQVHEALVWTAVAMRKLEAGDVLGAIDDLRRATSVSETYAPAHYQLGRAFQRLAQHDAARAAFARAHRLNPSLVAPPADR
jgi:tetratricopeptide (TPR) repeat protein